MAAMVVFGCFHDSKTSSKVVHFGSKFWINVNGWIGWIWISLQGLHSNFLSSFSCQEFLIYSQGPSRLSRFQHLLMLLTLKPWFDVDSPWFFVWHFCFFVFWLNTANFVAFLLCPQSQGEVICASTCSASKTWPSSGACGSAESYAAWESFLWLDLDIAFKSEKKFIFESPFDMFWIVFQDLPLRKKGGPVQMHDTIHGIHQTHRLCFLCDPQRTEVISGLGVVVGTLNSDSVKADFGLLTQQGCCRP